MKSPHILVKRLDKFFRQFLPRNILRLGTINNLVVYIGEVSYVCDVVPTMLQVTENGIKNNPRPGMTNMAIIVDRDSTNIHSYYVFTHRLKYFLFAG